MKTKHQYLTSYPIVPESLKLILGTIHPHEHSVFRLPFFYGNRNSLWSILAKAFPNKFSSEPTLIEILRFLTENKIAVSDTIEECRRKYLTALDSDIIDIKFNSALFSQIEKSNITEIFFTSGLSKNNASKLFIDELIEKGKITKDSKRKLVQSLKATKEAILEENVFGRKIKLTILFSPSGSANIGISKSKQYLEKAHLYVNSTKPVSDFKIDYYKVNFNKEFFRF